MLVGYLFLFLFTFEKSLFLNDNHSCFESLKYNRLPIVFMASGIPLHFLKISIPISLIFKFSCSYPFSNAFCLNKDHGSSSFKPLKKYGSIVVEIFATFSSRVVTNILLPLSPLSRSLFKLSHFCESSFHASLQFANNIDLS